MCCTSVPRIKNVDQSVLKSNLCQAFKRVKLHYSCLKRRVESAGIERSERRERAALIPVAGGNT